jgi:S1-C subfamily serine protease
MSAMGLGLWQLISQTTSHTTSSINYRVVQIVFVAQQKQDNNTVINPGIIMNNGDQAIGNTAYNITPIGTGVIVNNDGYVITAGHLIDAGQQYIQQSQSEIKKLGIIIVGPSAGVAPLYQLTNDFDVIGRDEKHDLALLKIKMTQSMTPEGDMESFVHYIYGIDGTLDVGDAPFTTNVSQNSRIAITGYTSAQLTLETKDGKVTSAQIPDINNSLISVVTGNVTYNFTDYYQTDITANSIFSGSPVYSTSNGTIMGICNCASQDEFDNSGTVDIIPSKYILALLKSNIVK